MEMIVQKTQMEVSSECLPFGGVYRVNRKGDFSADGGKTWETNFIWDLKRENTSQIRSEPPSGDILHN